MKSRLLLLTLLLLMPQILCSQEKDTIKCTTPRLPFFGMPSGEENTKGLKHIVSKYYCDNHNNVYFKFTRDVGSSRAFIVTSYHKIDGASVDGFEACGETWYAKDKHSVFYSGVKIENADPCTFEPLNLSYAKDKNTIYFKACKIEEADRNTFRPIDNGGYYDFAYDKNLLYFYQDRIAIDSATFSVDYIEDPKGFTNVCRDKKNLYYLTGTSFDGYITIVPKTDSMITGMFKREDGSLRDWSVRPYKVKVIAENDEAENKLQEKIYAEFEESLKTKYISFTKGTYRLKNLKLTFAYENHETEYDVEPWGGNYLLLSEDATEKYQEKYPEAGIKKVLLVIGMHTD